MNSLKLKNKIFFVLLLPLISICILSILIIFENIEQQNKIKETSSYLKISQAVSSLIYQFQIERNISNKYLNSYGERYKKNLLAQVENTINTEIELENSFKEFDNHKSFIKEYKQKKEELKVLRDDVLSLRVDESTLLNFYDEKIKNLFLFLDELILHSTDSKISKLIQSYVALSNLIDKSFKEKQLLEEIFSIGKIQIEDYYNIGSLLSSQKTYIDIFEKNSTDDILKIYNEFKLSDSYKQIEKYREILLYKNQKDNLLLAMKGEAGYGGLIHDFKNYILRGDSNYLTSLQQKHTNILRTIRKYKRLKNVTKEEKKHLKTVQRVFDKYLLASDEIAQYKQEGLSILEIDEKVKIDDTKALETLDKLSKTIYGTSLSQWSNISTLRIEELRKLDYSIIERIKKEITKKELETSNNIIYLVSFIIVLIVLSILSVILISKKVGDSIKEFQDYLNDFFKYSMREKETIEIKEAKGKDEFAQMTLEMNNQIERISSIIEKDKKVVNEISDVVEKVSNGFFMYSIKSQAATSEVEALRGIINKMIDRTKLKLENINLLLNNYTSNNYTFELNDIQKKGMYGDFGIVYNSTTLLAQTTSQLIAMITNAGKELNDNTTTLATSSYNLSIAANQQASSLEQTAASLEEITMEW